MRGCVGGWVMEGQLVDLWDGSTKAILKAEDTLGPL